MPEKRYIDGQWCRAMRFDSSHGQPHKHSFYPDGTERRDMMGIADNNQAFTEAQAATRRIFWEVHSQYLRFMRRVI